MTRCLSVLLLLIILILALPSTLLAMTLSEYLQAVQKQNRNFQSYTLSVEASGDRRISEDVDLIPTLSGGVSYLSDKSPLGQFSQMGATETTAKSVSLGLGKKFSSGTEVGISANGVEIENVGNLLVPAFQKFSNGALGVSLKQSLWKNFFGHGTRLKWKRLDAATEAEVGKFNLQKKLLLIDAEAAFWDVVYLRDYLIQGRESLARSEKIEGWTRRRARDGIGDRADLYSIEALVAGRKLQVLSSEDELNAAYQKVRDFLELKPGEPTPQLFGQLSQSRDIKEMVDGQGQQGSIVALQAYLASLNAKATELAARETVDYFRPDVILSGSYNTNAFEQNGSLNDALKNARDTDRPTWEVGLSVVYLFDTSVKASAKSAAQKDALAARLNSERAFLESQSQWKELLRRNDEMGKRVAIAEQVAKLQTASAKAQANLFNMGRTLMSVVVTAEEDAGIADLNLVKLKSEQRKLEAQGRLFIFLEDN